MYFYLLNSNTLINGSYNAPSCESGYPRPIPAHGALASPGQKVAQLVMKTESGNSILHQLPAANWRPVPELLRRVAFTVQGADIMLLHHMVSR